MLNSQKQAIITEGILKISEQNLTQLAMHSVFVHDEILQRGGDKSLVEYLEVLEVRIRNLNSQIEKSAKALKLSTEELLSKESPVAID